MSLLDQSNRALSIQLESMMSVEARDEDEFRLECKRSDKIVALTKQIADNHRITLDAVRLAISNNQTVDVDSALLEIGYKGIRSVKPQPD